MFNRGRPARSRIPKHVLLMAALSIALLPWTAQADTPTEPRRHSSRIRLPPTPAIQGPLRYENISDVEVRQVQSVVAGIVPGALVYISGVVQGCGCEEGLSCTDQLAVVAHHDGEDTSLTLSKLDGQWKIGRLQDWWLRYRALGKDYNVRSAALIGATRAERRALLEEHSDAQQALLAEMPACRAVAPEIASGSAPPR